MQMSPPSIEPDTILTLLGADPDGTIPSFHAGGFKWKETRTLRPANNKADQPLSINVPKKEVILPNILRSRNGFKQFAKDHKISLIQINIDDLIAELSKRVRLL